METLFNNVVFTFYLEADHQALLVDEVLQKNHVHVSVLCPFGCSLDSGEESIDHLFADVLGWFLSTLCCSG